jgi:hypothetical protein
MAYPPPHNCTVQKSNTQTIPPIVYEYYKQNIQKMGCLYFRAQEMQTGGTAVASSVPSLDSILLSVTVLTEDTKHENTNYDV